MVVADENQDSLGSSIWRTAQQIGSYADSAVTKPVRVLGSLAAVGAAKVGAAATGVAEEALQEICYLCGIAAARHKKNDASEERIRQMLEEQRAKQQQPKPEEQTATNIDPGELQGGILQDNNPAVSLNDQVEMVPTGRTAMASTTAQQSNPVAIAAPNPQDTTRQADAATAPSAQAPSHTVSSSQTASPTTSASLPANFTVGKPSVNESTKTPEELQKFINQNERSEQGLHAQPGLPNAARYFAEQEALEAAEKQQQSQFVYIGYEDIEGYAQAKTDEDRQKAIDDYWRKYMSDHPVAYPQPAPAVAIGNALPPKAAKSQANDNGDSENQKATQPAAVMPMGPSQKPPTDDEDEDTKGAPNDQGISEIADAVKHNQQFKVRQAKMPQKIKIDFHADKISHIFEAQKAIY